jgi:hypothetical protein
MKRVTAFVLLATALTATLSADDAAPKRPAAVPATSAAAPAGDRATSADAVEAAKPRPERQIFSGEVVFLRDALKERGIKSYDEEIKGQVVLECDDGELIPILADWRGRAFYQDERLRNRKVELVGYRQKGVPYLNVLVVFTFNEKGERQHTDYWCDVCAIPMYEIQPCLCCQADIRIRYTKKDLPAGVKPKPHSAPK